MKTMNNIGKFIKYLLQGFGLMLLAGFVLIMFASLFGSGANSLYNSEAFGIFALFSPLVYAIVRLLSDNSDSIAAANWRKRFDNDHNAKSLLQQVKALNPTFIYLIYDYPPEERPAPPQRELRNPMYPTSASAHTSTPTFQPQIRITVADGKVHAFQWPYTDVKGSMSYFPWWLEHQLNQGKWHIGALEEKTGGRAMDTYTVTENNRGGYSAYRDYSDPVVYRYGWFMQKK